ncbi:hypothetical protein [Alkalimonas sp.]|uniref:hypothetical protein n=1 Tax=Alkalimonas sp. TaxID=1872453 RepID=UPI00263B3F49|nr:hypothetical protein [Alkalimonas sp.]MCC5826438.1 hypothetical protein [Alkalimonas sp.]
MLTKNHVALRDATVAPTKSLSLTALALVLLGVSSLAYAGRPMITDDATLVDDCQLESWWQRNRGPNEFWLAPACQLAGVEWGFGYASQTAGAPELYELAAKTELRVLEPNNWGATLGFSHGFAQGSFRGDQHLNLAVTHSFADDAWLLHSNLGYASNRDSRNEWTAGVALEREVFNNHWAFVEVFRETAGRPFYQLGYRFEPKAERLQLDISYGNRLSSSANEHWVSAGFVFYFTAF